MTRAAGDSPYYTFQVSGRPDQGFRLPSVTHVIHFVRDSMGFGGMAYWGFKLGVASQHPRSDEPKVVEFYEKAKKTPFAPNKQRDTAGVRGTGAHDIAEMFALGTATLEKHDGGYIAFFDPSAEVKEKVQGVMKTRTETYRVLEGWELGAARWWVKCMKDHEVAFAERTVWSLKYGFAGTLDLGRWLTLLHAEIREFEIVDYKTHKPAFEDGPSYVDDRDQLAAYRIAVEEMGLGPVSGTRVVLFSADGKYVEDDRQAPDEDFLELLYRHNRQCKKCRDEGVWLVT